MDKITISKIELDPVLIPIKSHDDARPYVGRRVRLYWVNALGFKYSRGEGILALSSRPSPFYGADSIGVEPGEGTCGCGHGGSTAVYLQPGDGIAQIELLDSEPAIEPQTDSLAEQLAAAQAEVARIEAEIAAEAENARFPLPEGYAWEDPQTAVCKYGTVGISVSDPDEYVSGEPLPAGTVVLTIDDPDDPDEVLCARLDVVRALLARYDASQASEDSPKAPPYSIDVEDWCMNVNHDFREGDVIELTFESGRTEVHTIDDIDPYGDIFVSGRGFQGDDGDPYALVGRRQRGVTKVTLVSRGAE